MSELAIDIVCPWCFIGKRRIEAALQRLRKERPEITPAIRWLPYFLKSPCWPASPPDVLLDALRQGMDAA